MQQDVEALIELHYAWAFVQIKFLTRRTCPTADSSSPVTINRCASTILFHQPRTFNPQPACSPGQLKMHLTNGFLSGHAGLGGVGVVRDMEEAVLATILVLPVALLAKIVSTDKC